jgi:hypothetical protein
MKVVISTCDAYRHIVPVNLHLLRKYWPGQEDITVLCYDTGGLEDLDVELVSMGEQEKDAGGYWSNGVSGYFRDLEEDYFVLIMEELVLVAPVKQDMLDKLEAHVAAGKAHKAMIHAHLNLYGSPHEDGLVILDQDSPYRTSLHPAIWRTEYINMYLRPNLTPQRFELGNEGFVRNDGYDIISAPAADLITDHVYPCLDLYGKGQLRVRGPAGLSECPRLQEEDRQEILSHLKPAELARYRRYRKK